MELTQLVSVHCCFMIILGFVQGKAPICFTCDNIHDTTQCKNFTQCRDGELCFQEQNLVTSGGALNSVGCASSDICQLSSKVFGKREVYHTRVRGLQLCYQCCSTDFCNYRGCHQDHCSTQICQHNGKCTNTNGDYHCQCVPGYTGKNCETEIDECASSPCMNGGFCSDKVNGFTCTCVPGYVGTHCEKDINECASSPCQNGGVCVDQVNGFACLCPVMYEGIRCESLSALYTTTPPPKDPTSCYLCADGTPFFCETSVTKSRCSDSSEQYCANVLINNADGSRYIDRRCANETYCRTHWTQDSKTRADCTTYDTGRNYMTRFECTYCCTGPLCNHDVVPHNLL